MRMSQKDSFVKFEKVDKSYDGEILVVKDLNLDVPKGEFLTMLGPSGSGKTTVLMMLAGFETPTSGEIYLDGNPISSIPPNKRGIGMVFQNYALFPHMTVKENLAFPLEASIEHADAIPKRPHNNSKATGSWRSPSKVDPNILNLPNSIQEAFLPRSILPS